MNRTYRTGSDARTGEERPLKPWGTQPETGLDNNNNDRGQFGQRKKSHGRVLAAQVVAADDRSNNQPHTVWYGNITGTGPANNAPQAVRLWLGRIGVEIRSWSASLLLLSLSLSCPSHLFILFLSSISLDSWQSCLHIHVAQSHGQSSSVLLSLPRYFIANYHPSSPPR